MVMGCAESSGVNESGYGCRWPGPRWRRRGDQPEGCAWLDVDVRMLETTSSRLTCGEVERRMPMNRYGQMAMDHWKTWLPARYSLLEDPQAYFASLGEQVEEMILEQVAALEAANADRMAGMDYLTRVGTLNALQSQAEEPVLAEMVLLAPEPSRSEQEAWETPASLWERTPGMDADGMPIDRSHPLWAMVDDETVSGETYRSAYRTWLRAELDSSTISKRSRG